MLFRAFCSGIYFAIKNNHEQNDGVVWDKLAVGV